LIKIYVDADSCPVKNEVLRVAGRYRLKVCFVSNLKVRVPQDELIETVVVNDGLDAADDWIVEHIGDEDIVVSADVPLASRCLKKGARVLDHKGRIFTEDSIGEALANRDLMTYLRDLGNITGGPPPRKKRDHSRFLQRLDDLIQLVLREKK
jgi:uncharacterized protein YaiI (UPF0178 family)